MGPIKKPKSIPARKKSMGLLNRVSIRGKLLIVIMTVSLFAMLLAGSVFLFYQWFGFRQWLTEDLSATAGLIAENTKGALSFNDPKDAKAALQSLETIDSITAACLYTKEGKKFAFWFREGSAPLSSLAPESEGRSLDGRNMIMSRHVIVNDQIMGTVVLRSNQKEMTTFVRHTVIAIGLMVLLGSILSFVLSTRLQEIISHPVSYLARIMESVSRDQDYSVRGVRQSDDELGELTDYFNNMLTQIQMRDEEIREREQLLQSIINNTSSVIYLKDPESRFIMVNRRYEEFFLDPGQDIVGKTDYDIFPENLAKSFRENDRIVLEKDSLVEFEEQALHEDGTHFYISAKFPLHNEDGQIYAICGISTDITERKREEAERERLTAILENTSDLVSSAWPDGRIIFMNHAGRESLGWNDEKQINTKIIPDAHPEWAFHIVESEGLPAAIKNGVWEGENAIIGADGTEIPVSQVIMAHKGSDGEVEYFSSIMRDITEPKRTQAEMNQLRSLLKNIIDSMPSVIVGVDPEGHVMQWNREAERVTGLAAEKAQGHILTEVYPQQYIQIEKIRQAVVSRETQKDSKVAVHVAGETRFSDITIYPLVSNGVEGAVIRVDDVTEKARIEEMMVQSEKMLSVGGLAAGMAHEINNPLAGMMINAQNAINRLTIDSPANEQAAALYDTSMGAIKGFTEKRDIRKMLEAINESGKRAAEIVDNMLSFSRKSESRFSFCDMRGLLDKTVDLASTDYDLKKEFDFRKIDILREYDSDIPPIYCEGSKIQQVIFNLLKNAAEAMGEQRDQTDPPRILVRTKNEGQKVRIEVEDNGPGMPEDVKKRSFEPFFTTKGVGVGTGLGLSVSYFIITEDHGGTMSVESVPGKGSKFIIHLPVEREGSHDSANTGFSRRG